MIIQVLWILAPLVMIAFGLIMMPVAITTMCISEAFNQ